MFRTVALVAMAVLFPLGAFAAEGASPRTSAAAVKILDDAQAALDAAGTVRAKLEIEAWYPMHYTSKVTLTASPNGDERAVIKTTIREDSYDTLQVVSGGVIWTETETVGGTMVTMTDINEVKKAFKGAEKAMAALGLLGTNALYDLAGLRRTIDFTDVTDGKLGERAAYILSGGLRERFDRTDKSLGPVGMKFYAQARVYIDTADSLPRRVELGAGADHPLLRLDIIEIETNVTAEEGTFSYEPGEGVTVIDRTAWAIRELKSE